MAVEQGRNIFIYSGTTALIAGAKSCTISKSCEVREKASATSATAREYVAGRTEWEISISHLIVTASPYDGIIKVGGTYPLSVVVGGVRKTGNGICVQAEINGTVGNLGTGQAKFKGTGELT
jgi:hypothetical protein